ncbi:hypothetical protein PVAP13_2KG589401 [Panicum virgatum]|uniref:Uncharacterized protein n=1 Tax=Panicum virgatum TaxID=38727 RepID=A0A8T0WQX2_PANVG|nr:hypothetical protein PVAP13_2KG589401 [Panicum virgatum]
MQKKLDLHGAALEASAAGAPRLAPPPGSTASGRAPRRRAFPSPARRTAAFPPAAARVDRLGASSSPPCLPFAGSPHRGLPAHRRHASPPRGLPAAGPSRRLRPAAGQLPRLGAEEQRSYRQARRSRGPAAWGGGAGVPSVSSEEQGPGGAGAEKLLDPDKENGERGREREWERCCRGRR